MDFWDTLKSLTTEEGWASDNPHRRARVQELGRDCQNFLAGVAPMVVQIRDDLHQLHQQLARPYGDPDAVPGPLRPNKVGHGGMVFEVSPVASPLMNVAAVPLSLELSALTHAVATNPGKGPVSKLQDDILGLRGPMEAVLEPSPTPGIGLVMKLGMNVLDTVNTVAQARQLIAQASGARAKTAQAYLVDSRLKGALEATLQASRAMLGAHLPAEVHTERVTRMLQAVRPHLEEITQASVRDYLAALDTSRGSWTKEDPPAPAPAPAG
ncbi:hypothetical protein ACIBF1_21650 [Spirillospora sp. NPDC050679]